jgi:hypothetical protein
MAPLAAPVIATATSDVRSIIFIQASAFGVCSLPGLRGEEGKPPINETSIEGQKWEFLGIINQEIRGSSQN